MRRKKKKKKKRSFAELGVPEKMIEEHAAPDCPRLVDPPQETVERTVEEILKGLGIPIKRP